MSLASALPLHTGPDSGATILIVEDHPATRQAVTALLDASFPGSRVVAVISAEDAMPVCQAEIPDIVVMDISLPGMNGLDATRFIKSEYPMVQVVMHSSSDMPIFREESTAAGASAFISKGRTSRDLVPVISRLLAADG